MSKLYKIYNDQPKAIKTAIALVTVLVAGYAIFSIFQIVKKKGLTDTGIQDAKKDLKDLEKQGLKPSYNNSQFETWASQLHKAMKDYGTDSDTVYRIFGNMKNKADILKLIEIYGKRPETGGLFAGHLTDQDLSLAEQIQSDFSNSDIEKINKIFKSKRIDFQF
jgi:hypothetical protein